VSFSEGWRANHEPGGGLGNQLSCSFFVLQLVGYDMTNVSKEGIQAIFALTAGASGQPFALRLDRWEWISSRLKILVAGQWVVLEEFRASRLFLNCIALRDALKRPDDAVLRIEWDDRRIYVSYGEEPAERRDLSQVGELLSAVHDELVDLDRFGTDVFVLMGANGFTGRVTRDRDANLQALMADGASWRTASDFEQDLLLYVRDGVAALQSGDDVVFWDPEASRWGRGTFLCTALNITQRGNRVRRNALDRDGAWFYHVLPAKIGKHLGIAEAADVAA
jgi:hypothetical protein